MKIKPELVSLEHSVPDWELICEALRFFSFSEMERVSAMAQSDERAHKAFSAGLAMGLRSRIMSAITKEASDGH